MKPFSFRDFYQAIIREYFGYWLMVLSWLFFYTLLFKSIKPYVSCACTGGAHTQAYQQHRDFLRKDHEIKSYNDDLYAQIVTSFLILDLLLHLCFLPFILVTCMGSMLILLGSLPCMQLNSGQGIHGKMCYNKVLLKRWEVKHMRHGEVYIGH